MSKKILFFEGAGCVPRGDVENCRIRTAFINDEGKRFYLELSGMEPHKHTPKEWSDKWQYIGFVDYCYELGSEGEKCGFAIERKTFGYSKQEILDFVNSQLGCSFESLVVTDMFDMYRVHKDGGGYNLMDDFKYNPERAAKARAAFDRIDKQIRQQLNKKYSKITLHSQNEHAITVRCYASDKSMKEHGLDPNNRYMTILL